MGACMRHGAYADDGMLSAAEFAEMAKLACSWEDTSCRYLVFELRVDG